MTGKLYFLFFALLAFLPLSTEFEVGGGFSTDLPTEPIMVGLMFLYLLIDRYSITLTVDLP